MTDIHDRIKALRLHNKLSMEALAEKVGVSWQAVQLWEKPDGTAPKLARLRKVAEALGTTPEYLVSGVTIGVMQARESTPVSYRHPNKDIQRIADLLEKTSDIGIGRVLEAAINAAEEHPKTERKTA